ncbi:MAG TPA: hypothetical protein VGC90_05170, partial [Candidatus Limnocylindrales bacterium]
RIVGIDKAKGTFVEQYRLAGGATAWNDVRGMYVIPGVNDAPATLIWTTANAVHQSFLAAVAAPVPGASGAPAASGPTGSAAPAASPKASAGQ